MSIYLHACFWHLLVAIGTVLATKNERCWSSLQTYQMNPMSSAHTDLSARVSAGPSGIYTKPATDTVCYISVIGTSTDFYHMEILWQCSMCHNKSCSTMNMLTPVSMFFILMLASNLTQKCRWAVNFATKTRVMREDIFGLSYWHFINIVHL